MYVDACKKNLNKKQSIISYSKSALASIHGVGAGGQHKAAGHINNFQEEVGGHTLHFFRIILGGGGKLYYIFQ